MATWTHTFDTPVFAGKVSIQTGLYVGGQFSHGSSMKTIPVINPATGKTIAQVSEATAGDVDRAVASARKAFHTVWGLKCPGVERGRLLSRLADLVEVYQNELAAIEALNSGTPFMSAKSLDMSVAVASLRDNAGWASKIRGKIIETTEKKLAYTRREPLGVCGQISPWNFPLMMVLMKLGPALAAGNTVVIKPSEVNPLTTLRFCSLVKEAGIPDGVVNVVVGYGLTVGQAITEHMDINKVTFTGSTAGGKKVMESAARSNLKNITLELGGKNPAIIFDDADLDEAVKWACHGSFFNAGQVCVATSRLFVHASIYDKFLASFTAVARTIKLGDPFNPATTQGPQASQAHFKRIMDHIQSGIAEGATLHLGGQQHSTHGLWIEPTVFTDVRPDMRIAREESFGPVVALMRFESEEDVLQMANDTIYGLAAGVFTRDVDRAVRMAHRLQAGTIWINEASVVDPLVTFGGLKQSGIGCELGEDGLLEYTSVKAVHLKLGSTVP